MVDAIFDELFSRAEALRDTGAPSPFTAAYLMLDGERVAEEVCAGDQGLAVHRLLEREGLPQGSQVTLFTILEPAVGHHDARLKERGWRMESALAWPGTKRHPPCPWDERAKALVLGWARGQRVQQPEVTCKVACTLDGHIATASGESQWITGEAARLDGHRLRAVHDAILVGIETALADDPSLTCRHPDHPDAHPVPVVLDTRLRLPKDAGLLGGPRRAMVFAGPDAPERVLNADVHRVPVDAQGHVNLEAVLTHLSNAGLHRVLIEGGGRVHRSALDARLVDRVVMYQAPTVLPGGRPWVAGSDASTLSEGLGFEVKDVVRIGSDLRLTLAGTRRFADPWTDEDGSMR